MSKKSKHQDTAVSGQDKGLPGMMGAWLVIAAAMLWGSTGTTQALAPEGANPAAIGMVRLFAGSAALLALAVSKGAFPLSGRIHKRAILLTGLLVAAYQLCFFAGVALTGVAVGTMVGIGSAPVMGGLLGYFLRGEPLRWRWGAATILALCGCALLTFGTTGVQVNMWGILLAMGAGASYAAYTATLKGILEDQPADAALAIVFTTASLLVLPLCWITDFRWILSWHGAATSLHLGLFTCALSYWLFARGLERVHVGTATTLSLAEPLTAALLGIFVLGEQLSLSEFSGIIVLFFGLLLLATDRSTESSAKLPADSIATDLPEMS